MRLGIDVHALGEQRTGVGTYVRELVRQLRHRLEQEDDLALELIGKSEHRGEIAGEFAPHPRLRLTDVDGRRFWTGLHLPLWFWRHRHAVRNRMDVMLFPAHHVPIFVPVASLVTVHDVAFLDAPHHFTRRDRVRLRHLTKGGVSRATRILADSEATAEAVIRHYGVAAHKIVVAPLAVDPERFARPPGAVVRQVLQRYGLPPGYLVTVGTLQPRKNYVRLIEAVATLARRGARLTLVIVGGRGWLYEPILQAAERLKTQVDVRFLGYVPEADLPALITGASVAAQVGMLEGFGLPVLEAFACGTPMVVADEGAISEVAGDAAVRVEPTRVDAIAAGIETMLSDPELRERYKTRMSERLSMFSWKKTADVTLDAARQALESRRMRRV